MYPSYPFDTGKVGDWKNHLSSEMARKFDDMITTKVEPLGLTVIDSLPD